MTFQVGQVVEFDYRYFDSKGQLRVATDDGVVIRIYNGGHQFVLADNMDGRDPRRHEHLTIVHVARVQ